MQHQPEISRRNSNRVLGFLAVVIIFGCGGCGGGPIALMPTPNVYANHYVDLFVNVPSNFRTNTADVLYLTDRVPVPQSSPENTYYSANRSRSVAFGISQIDFGQNLSWDDLVKASDSSLRILPINVSVAKTTELGRFPQTPRSLRAASRPASAPDWRPPYLGAEPPDDESIAAEKGFQKALTDYLAVTQLKEVYLFVHGYNNSFADSVVTIAQMWHFLGRQGVPVAYSWPAGASGLLRGYTRDSESSEFTVFHLKQALRQIAACPEVKKVHIIAHSRGTAVTCSALRELHLEIAGSGHSTREALKLGTLVLAAPDMDVDTVIQRMSTVHLGQVPERLAIYVCKNDKALTMSNWLFEGINRLGMLDSKMFTQEELEAMRKNKNVQIIEARVSDAGAFGHDYFHSNPAVSSDLVLLMRYALPPGAEYGRPLRINPNGFWYIDDAYPGPPATEQTDATTKPKESP